MKTLSVRRLVSIMLLVMAGINLWLLWKAREQWLQGYGDFTAFYTAGTLVLRGQSAEIYNRNAEWAVQQEFASKVEIRRGPLPYIRPPFEALLFAAFAVWPYPVALVLWTVFKSILLFVIPLIVVRRGEWHESYPPWFAGVLAFGTFPVFTDFLLGQDSVLLAFLFAVAFRQLATGSDRAAGFTLGLGLFKFHLVLPFVAMALLAGRKKLASGFALTTILFVVISAALVGWKGLAHYPNYILSLKEMSGVGMMNPESQNNLRALLLLLLRHLASPGHIDVLVLLAALVAIIYVGTVWRRAGHQRLPEAFGLALIAAIVTSYYSYRYDLSSLAIPLLASEGTREASSAPASRLEVAGVLLLLFTPLYWFLKLHLDAEFLITIPLIAIGWALLLQLRSSPR